MAELAILNEKQLRLLARVIYYQEAEAIKNIKFTSELELAKYLRVCKANYKSVLDLLDDGSQLELKFQDDKTLGPIALDISSYIVNCANSALQIVQNYTLRTDYLKKIGEHASTLMGALKKLDATKATIVAKHPALASLAEEAVQYKNAILEYTKKYGSNVSRKFSKVLKESGFKFEDLVQRYQRKLNFPGPFKDLDDIHKIQVYEEIMEASGRGRVKVFWSKSKVLGVAAISVMLFNAGMMAWEIFSSDHILQTATQVAIVTAASFGGAMLGEVVGVALATALVGAAASPLFVVMAGIIGGFVGAFIVGEFAGWLVDLIFGSGGTAPFSTDGHRCYVATLPNGAVLARQIAHRY